MTKSGSCPCLLSQLRAGFFVSMPEMQNRSDLSNWGEIVLLGTSALHMGRGSPSVPVWIPAWKSRTAAITWHDFPLPHTVEQVAPPPNFWFYRFLQRGSDSLID